jgi:uncharacterized protein (DUF849 family)
MGRLAELFEKKANGSISEAELKEYDQLLKEAEALSVKKEEEAEGTEEVVETDEDVDKMAQAFADKVTGKIADSLTGINDVVSRL